MNKYLIYKYSKNITKQDIINFSNSQNISLTTNELNTIYYYIINKTKIFLEGNRELILQELKNKLTSNTYNKIIELYNKYKDKLD